MANPVGTAWNTDADLSSMVTRRGYRERIEATRLPLVLAARHRALSAGSVVSAADLLAGPEPPPTGPVSFDDLAIGAGFEPIGPGRYRRAVSLPDSVGADMRLLVIGLNPSPAASEAGVGFARPGNRFWPAALAAGLVTKDRDADHALRHHGVGFTDLAKRTTRRASELTPDELDAGFARVDRLCRWLEPAACVMVGLLGWRTAVDRRAVAGWQETPIGGRPAYLMPSTSGLNAHASLADLTAHLATVAR